MHKKGPALRQRQKAAPALTASPCSGGGKRPVPLPVLPFPLHPSTGRPQPGAVPPPYLPRRRPQTRVAPGGGAAVVIHEEGPARLRVDLDLPAGGQRLGAALHLRRWRWGVRGGAHGEPVSGPYGVGCPVPGGGAGPADLSAAGRGGAEAPGWKCLETAATRGAGGGGGGGTRAGGRREAEEEEEGRGGHWQGWKLLVVSSTARRTWELPDAFPQRSVVPPRGLQPSPSPGPAAPETGGCPRFALHAASAGPLPEAALGAGLGHTQRKVHSTALL